MTISFFQNENNEVIEVLGNVNKIDGYTKIEPNTKDAAKEKHIPFVYIEEDSLFIQVGEVLHPMEKEHLIQKIIVLTDKGDVYEKRLNAFDKPEFTVTLNNERYVDVYAVCNLHGVWKTSITL